MRKLLQRVCFRGLLVLMVCFGSLQLQAKTYTNKTFLATRSHNDNMAMEYAGWHKQTRKMMGKRWGGSFQATGFYQASTNDTDLGKYFGKYNSATGPNALNPYAGTIQDFIWVADRTTDYWALLLDPDFMIHDRAEAVTDTLDVKGTLRPEQTSYGIRLDYHQKLDKLAKGLYFKVSAPIVRIKNDMSMSYTGGLHNQQLTQIQQAKTPATVSLADYLAGRVYSTAADDATNIQDRLTHAKISGSQSTTAFADVTATFGYNFLYKEHKHLGVNVCLVIPTNDTPDGTWLFDAEHGLRGHWALGLGLDGAFELWQHGNKSIEFVGALSGKYVLPETEKRTLGFKYDDALVDTPNPNNFAGKLVPMGHYMLGGMSGVAGTFPLANVLTRDVMVRPGWQLEGLANMAFNWGNFTLDLGYNLYASERESVSVKTWADNTYGIADNTYNTISTNPFAADGTDTPADIRDGSVNGFIQRDHLVTESCVTPVQVTHKVYGGASYAFNGWEYPMMFGLGASWEFTQGSNAALDGYGLWLKTSINF